MPLGERGRPDVARAVGREDGGRAWGTGRSGQASLAPGIGAAGKENREAVTKAESEKTGQMKANHKHHDQGGQPCGVLRQCTGRADEYGFQIEFHRNLHLCCLFVLIRFTICKELNENKCEL